MERYYMSPSGNQVWRVTDQETRYFRVIVKSEATGEEDYCYVKKKTTEQDEAYIKRWNLEATWEIFSVLMVKYFTIQRKKADETEKFFKTKF